ncbi:MULTISPECIES: ATP-binding protein [Deinococcus]|uniref:histidine kinase n=1 Tax=Deinococcus rufus TaxID=2136097 RepID=A0ABV7Z4L8_9DEIO|nr:ATP-binding protein [Deinococcus sp. AB2017081]WQE94853.1 ATP-binding protein [Deinococcus sp. AB2017081]
MTAEPVAHGVRDPGTEWYDRLPLPVWGADGAGRITFVNAAWSDVTGPEGSRVGVPFTQAVHPDDRAAALAAWEQAQRSGQPYRAQFRLRRHDGAYRTVQADGRPHLDPQGGGPTWVTMCTDIHDHAQEHHELASRAAMLQDIVDANADCIKVLSPDARLMSMNVGGMRVMEVDDFNACLNAVWPEFWQGDTRPLVEAALAAARAGGVGRFEGYCPTLKGSPRWWDVTITPIRNTSGEIVNLLATSRDITARRQSETALRDLNAELEARVNARTRDLNDTVTQLQRSNTELERFAYIAAHDLQEPIRTVTSFADILASRYAAQLDARGLKYLEFVQSGAGRMKSLVDDLLTYSRLTHIRPSLGPLEMAEPFEEALGRLRGRLGETGATVTHGALPGVLGDGPQLAQVFQNLIGNAVKFARSGVPPRVHLEAHQDGEFWRITVADNGIGMDAQYLKRIFEMFQRLHSRDEYEGTGLGLSVCQKIVEAHGGTIWASSEPGTGSTFTFTLRAALPPPPAGETGAAP